MMAGKPGLIRRDALDPAAPEKESVQEGVVFRMPGDAGTRRREVLKPGLGREQDHHAARKENSALIRPVWMNIHEWRLAPGGLPGLGDCREDLRQRAAMVEMPVREEDSLDRGEVDAQAVCVVLPDRCIRPYVEEQSVQPIAAPRGREHGEAMAAAAEAVEHDLARMPCEVLRRRWPSEMAHYLGGLRNAVVHAGQRVRLVVDHDRQSQLVELGDGFECHGRGKLSILAEARTCAVAMTNSGDRGLRPTPPQPEFPD